MRAIFNHSIFSEDNLLKLNWFMSTVEMSDSPTILVENLYKEQLLPNGLDGGTYRCYIEITPTRIAFYEDVGDDKGDRLIAYVDSDKN